MRLLITAGPTFVPIDSVRVITNLATGATGNRLAKIACEQGHLVTLLTSRPPNPEMAYPNLRVVPFGDLTGFAKSFRQETFSFRPDGIVHSAAISDFVVTGITNGHGQKPSSQKLDSATGPYMIQLSKAPKCIDQVRKEWGFEGKLIGFKLESGISDDALIREAETTRVRSSADWMVANHQETAGELAWIGPGRDGVYQKVQRAELPEKILELLTGAI